MPEQTPSEPVSHTFRPDHATYLRDHAWMAAIAMAAGMGILWLLGNPDVWTGAIGGLAAIGLRAWYLASEELAARWDMTESRLTGPSGRSIRLAEISAVNGLLSAVQIVTESGDKHLIKYQADKATTRRLIDSARRGVPS